VLLVITFLLGWSVECGSDENHNDYLIDPRSLSVWLAAVDYARDVGGSGARFLEWCDLYVVGYPEASEEEMKRFDGVMVLMVLLLLVGGFSMFRRAGDAGVDPAIVTMEPVAMSIPTVASTQVSVAAILLPPSEEDIAQFGYGMGVDFEAPPELQVEEPVEEVADEECDPAEFIAPYKDYKITQGPHGMSYGHFAIDIAAGKGAVIRSPICGIVTERYVDEYGNPTLVIENEFYRAMFLHGEYSVDVGKKLPIGKKIGTESNIGYTTTTGGVRCGAGSNCGFHTHLNVYDKRQGQNVNPLDLIGR
jgi:hypothetical protein